jgi:HAD superfamily hydrolase (TIGR01509 family)
MTKALGPVLDARGGTSEKEIAALIADLHALKTARYTELVRSGAVPARPGVRRLAAEADAAGWQLAVASTSAEASVRAVLTSAMGSELAARFEVFAGDAVKSKKPAPDIYLLAMRRLGIGIGDAVVVEDSGIGLSAARTAGLPTIVTVGPSTAHDDFAGAQLVLTSLGDPAGVVADVLSDPLGVGVGTFVNVGVLERIITAYSAP